MDKALLTFLAILAVITAVGFIAIHNDKVGPKLREDWLLLVAAAMFEMVLLRGLMTWTARKKNHLVWLTAPYLVFLASAIGTIYVLFIKPKLLPLRDSVEKATKYAVLCALGTGLVTAFYVFLASLRYIKASWAPAWAKEDDGSLTQKQMDLGFVSKQTYLYWIHVLFNGFFIVFLLAASVMILPIVLEL